MANESFTASLFSKKLPPSWKLVPAGAVLTGTQYGLSEPGDAEGNTPIVGMKDIANGIVNLDNLATIDGEVNGWTNYQLRRGDILLNRTNSPDLVGKVGIVCSDTQAVFASYLVRLNANRECVEPEFLNYWLNSPIAQRALKRLSTRGVSQANINPTEFQKHCPVPLPPLGEQRKIAAILWTWDDAIEKASRLIAVRKNQYLGLRDQLIDWSSKHQSSLRRFLNPVSRPVAKPDEKYRALSIRSHGKGTFSRVVENPDSVDMETLYVVKAGDIIVNITFAWEGAIALVPLEHDGCLVYTAFLLLSQ
jgi:type I restriction enzyme, S subunit